MHALIEKVKGYFTTEEHEVATKVDTTLALLQNLARRVEALEQAAVATVGSDIAKVETKL